MRFKHESVAINSLSLERLVELDVGDTNRGPCEQGSNRGQVLEPAEDNRWAARADGEICEPGDRASDDDTVVWDTSLAAAEKEAWGLLILSKSEEVTRSSVQESVGGRGGRCQNDGVDDRGKDFDTSILDTNDPWRLSCTGEAISLCLQQMWVV